MEVIWTSSKKLRSYDLDLQRPDAFDLALHFVTRFEKHGRDAREANARGRSGANDVARLKRHPGREAFDGCRNIKDHVASVAVLHDLAIDSANQANLLRIRQRALMHNPRTERTEGVERFSLAPL